MCPSARDTHISVALFYQQRKGPGQTADGDGGHTSPWNKHNLLIYFMSLTVKKLVDGATVATDFWRARIKLIVPFETHLFSWKRSCWLRLRSYLCSHIKRSKWCYIFNIHFAAGLFFLKSKSTFRKQTKKQKKKTKQQNNNNSVLSSTPVVHWLL